MDGGEKSDFFWSERVSNQLPLDDKAGSLPCELCCLWTWRGISDMQVQPKYSRRCSRILRLSGPNRLGDLILGMVRKWTFGWECEDRDSKD